MLPGSRRRPVAAVCTAVLCLLVAGTVLGGGYGLLRVSLRTPTDGERVAARAVGVRLRYRYVESDIRVAGRPRLTSRCLQGWLPQKGDHPAGRGARVVFSDGAHLLAGDRQIALVRNGTTKLPVRPYILVQLAGG